ncbi:hypothetical protein CRUP_038734 [Coryphaenoides rupestris]|nr:hypothetical protein CRUP_038734 [Coryphaenoides rupestris]
MSSNYSANQYESAYSSQRLQNWCVSKPGKQKGKSWPDFKGTWDLPARPHPCGTVNTTGRSVEGLRRLGALGSVEPTSTTQPPESSKETASPRQVEHFSEQDSAAPPAPRRTASATAHPTPPTPQLQNTGEVLDADAGPRPPQ